MIATHIIEIEATPIPDSFSNFTSEVAHFLTTIFGSIYQDEEEQHLVGYY
jgi:hypothetical protein